MEEGNLRGDIPLPDQKKKSNSELIRTSSESSGLTVDNANAIPFAWLVARDGREAVFIATPVHGSATL
uniref:Uncharacterized protein n=1 Tax=Populus trichocarpa TaxID=3694 RepID=A0A3N7ETL2_POPTR